MKNLTKFLSLSLTAMLLMCAVPCAAQTIIPKPKTKTNKTTTNHGSTGKTGNTRKKQSGNSSKSGNSGKKRSACYKLYYDDSTNEIVYGNHRYRMVQVPGGTFTMGASEEQGSDCNSDEQPAHRVTLSTYSLGATEVPQWLWVAVMLENPSTWKGDKLPVEHVSWYDCMDFISYLNFRTGKEFRLPTEAEWEYAARGGRSGGTMYSGSDNIFDVAWFNDNSGDRTHEVGTKLPNSLGLYDMTGNVWEWCADWYGVDYYSISPQTNPKGPSSGLSRVKRGGSWYYDVTYCRITFRYSRSPGDRYSFLGFRLGL